MTKITRSAQNQDFGQLISLLPQGRVRILLEGTWETHAAIYKLRPEATRKVPQDSMRSRSRSRFVSLRP